MGSNIPSSQQMTAAQQQEADEAAGRTVTRAACLNCRTAKRRCDGAMPICGPCITRGIQPGTESSEGGCVFVASRRGGPRYKGVKGSDAEKIKREREAANQDKLAAAEAANVLVQAKHGMGGGSSSAGSTSSSTSPTAGAESTTTGGKRKASAAGAQKEDAEDAGNGSAPRRGRKSVGGQSNGGGGGSKRSKASFGKLSNGIGNGYGHHDGNVSPNSTTNSSSQLIHATNSAPPPPPPAPYSSFLPPPPSHQHQQHPQANNMSYPLLGIACQPPFPNNAQTNSDYGGGHASTSGMVPPPPPSAAASVISGGAAPTNPNQSPHQNLSLANLQLWQRIQVQSQAYASGGGQTYSHPHQQQQQPSIAVSQPMLSMQAQACQPQQQFELFHPHQPPQQQQPMMTLPNQQPHQQQPSVMHPLHAQQHTQQQQPSQQQQQQTEMEKWMDFNMLDNFFNSVQSLPKAGTMGTWGDREDEMVMELISSHSSPPMEEVDVVDSEQQIRTL